jgi:hypothetical protein
MFSIWPQPLKSSGSDVGHLRFYGRHHCELISCGYYQWIMVALEIQ